MGFRRPSDLGDNPALGTCTRHLSMSRETLQFAVTGAISGSTGTDLVAIMKTQSNVGSRLCLTLNGEPFKAEARTLADLVVEAGFAEMRVATAVNEDFVPERARAARQLGEGDRVEIVSPRQGG